MHIKHVITHEIARILQMGKLLRDKHLSMCVKRTLALTALHPWLEYGAEVLVPTMALRCLFPPGSILGLWRMCSLRLLA